MQQLLCGRSNVAHYNNRHHALWYLLHWFICLLAYNIVEQWKQIMCVLLTRSCCDISNLNRILTGRSGWVLYTILQIVVVYSFHALAVLHWHRQVMQSYNCVIGNLQAHCTSILHMCPDFGISLMQSFCWSLLTVWSMLITEQFLIDFWSYA